MTVRDRPCRWDCNNRRCDPVRCFGRIVFPENDPRAYLGRGWMDLGGKPFGWAWNMEREAIRQHLRRRLWKFGLDGLARFRMDQRVDEIQRRLHRWNRPTMAERQALWKERCAAAVRIELGDLTPEEWQAIADRFAGANDQVGQSIHAKAAARSAPD